jgi:quercetin dioxygenase-like cupin family protein
MSGKVRRIVTAVNEAGRSYILSDIEVPTAEVPPGEPMRAGLWTTDSAPASNAGAHDPVPDGVITKIAPPNRGGTVFRIIEMLPESVRKNDPADLARRGGNTTAERSARHPGFHATNTVDYAICLEGEVWAILDEAETLMHTGDVLIQRGTFHAWANRSDRPARMAFILIDAEPLENHR